VDLTIKEFEIQYALGSLSDNMLMKLARNTNTPKEVLTILSKDEDRDVRYYVANNTSTPKEILTKLSKDKDRDVRSNVAYNTKYPSTKNL
jgi:hypothetical protein